MMHQRQTFAPIEKNSANGFMIDFLHEHSYETE